MSQFVLLSSSHQNDDDKVAAKRLKFVYIFTSSVRDWVKNIKIVRFMQCKTFRRYKVDERISIKFQIYLVFFALLSCGESFDEWEVKFQVFNLSFSSYDVDLENYRLKTTTKTRLLKIIHISQTIRAKLQTREISTWNSFFDRISSCNCDG